MKFGTNLKLQSMAIKIRSAFSWIEIVNS